MHEHNRSALDWGWCDAMKRQLGNMQLSYFHQVERVIYVLPPSGLKMVHGFCLDLHVLESVLCLPPASPGCSERSEQHGG